MTARGMRWVSIGIVAVWALSSGVANAAAGRQPASPLKGDAHSEAAATRRADVMLDRVTQPGIVRLPQPNIWSYITNGSIEVVRLRWFTVPGGPEAVMHYARLHPPTGFVADGPSHHFPAFESAPASTMLQFVPSDRRDSAMQVLELDASAAAGAGLVDLEAEAYVAWIPARTRLETLPARTSATIVADYGGTPDYAERIKLSPTVAHRLARQLNALPTTSSDETSTCHSAQSEGVFLTLTVSYRTHRATFYLPSDHCGPIGVVVDGRQQPVLMLDAQVDRTIWNAVDPPITSTPGALDG